MKPKVTYTFRVHTGQFDAHGERCLLFIGGRLIPDKERGFVWLTKPGGEKLLRVPRQAVEPVSREAAVTAICREALLQT